MPMDSSPPSEQPGTNSVFGPKVNLGNKPKEVEIVPRQAPHNEPVKMVPYQGELVPAMIPVAKELAEPKPLSEYISTDLTSEQRAALDKAGNKLRAGPSGAIPMQCRGANCPFVQVCPLHMNAVALPVGKFCPVEEAVMQAWKRDFIMWAGIPDDHENKALIYLLVDDIAASVAYQTRIGWANAIEPDIFREETVGVSQDGEPIVSRRLNPSLDLLNRTMSNKMKLLRELLATPRSEVEAKKKMGIDPSSQAAAAMAKLNRMNIKSATFKVDLGGPSTES